MKYEIHGKVTFATKQDGRLVSSQESGHENGIPWMTDLLVYAAFLIGEKPMLAMARVAAARVRKHKKKPSAPRAQGRDEK